MYQAFYKMKRAPFPTQPVPDVFFRSKTHAGAQVFFRHIVKEPESFVLVTGDYGMGKTLLCLRLVKAFEKGGQRYPFLYIPTPNYSYERILRSILEVLVLAGPDKEKTNVDSLLFEYFEKGGPHLPRRFFLIMDDAHEYDSFTLSNLKYLANYNTNDGVFPFSLILFAHPVFLERLRSPDFGSFRQKIKRHYVLDPFDFDQTREYIYFRLLYSGATGKPFFPDNSIEIIHKYSSGVPRLINNICDASLIIASRRRSDLIGKDIVTEAVRSMGLEEEEQKHPRPRAGLPGSTAETVPQSSADNEGRMSAQPSTTPPLSESPAQDIDFSNIGIDTPKVTEEKIVVGTQPKTGKSFFATPWEKKSFRLSVVVLILLLLVLLGLSFFDDSIFGKAYYPSPMGNLQKGGPGSQYRLTLPIKQNAIPPKSGFDEELLEKDAGKTLGNEPPFIGARPPFEPRQSMANLPLSLAKKDMNSNGTPLTANAALKPAKDDLAVGLPDTRRTARPYSLILSSNRSGAKALKEIAYFEDGAYLSFRQGRSVSQRSPDRYLLWCL